MSVYVTDENGKLYSLSGGSVPSENESNISNEAAEYYENLYDAAQDNLITHYNDECIISKKKTIGVFTKRRPHEFATNILTSILDLRPILGTVPTPIYYTTDMFELVDGIAAEYDMVFHGLEKNTKYTVSFDTFINWTDTTMFGVHVPVDDTSEHVVEFVTDNQGTYTFERGFKMSPVDAYSVHVYQFGMLCLVKGDYSGTARQFGDVVTAVELNSITYDTFKRSKKYTDDTSKNKVDVVEGKSLSTNDYTNEDVIAVTFAEVERQKSKNLLVYPYEETTKTTNGITFTDNGDGSITINGTNNGGGNSNFFLTPYKYKLKKGTYTLGNFVSQDNSGTLGVVFYDGKYYHGAKPNSSSTFTISEDMSDDKESYIYVGITKNDTVTFNNVVVKPTLVSGTELGDYQPYNGAIVHEKDIADVEHYKVIYARDSSDPNVNWGYTSGIQSSVLISRSFPGKKTYRVYFTIGGSNYGCVLVRGFGDIENNFSGGCTIRSLTSGNICEVVCAMRSNLFKPVFYLAGEERINSDTYVYRIEEITL